MSKPVYILALAVATFLSIGPGPASAQSFRSAELDVQYHRARTAWESGTSLYEAKARIDRVLKVLPEDVPALKLRTSVLMGLGRPEEAIDDALVAVRVSPADGEAQLLLCETALANQNSNLARTALLAAQDLIVEQVQLLVRLSSCALSMSELPRAEAFARLAVARDSMDSRGHIQLARIFVRSNRRPAAASVLNKMIAMGIASENAIKGDSELFEALSAQKNR